MAEKKEKTTLPLDEESNASELEQLVSDLPGEVIADLNVNPEDDDKIPLDPETGLDPQKLEEELEGLKDLVQDEIDKMMESNPDAEWTDIVKAAKEEKDNRHNHTGKLCECCGENYVDDDGVYCEDCLETMKHYPFEWWKLIIPALTVVLVVLSFSFFAISWPVYSETAAAQKLVAEGKLSSALEAYDKINAEIKVTDENYGDKYLLNQVKIYETIGIDEYESLSKFIDKYYVGNEINKRWNAPVRQARDTINSYQKLYEIFETAMSSSSDYKSFEKNFDDLAGSYDEAFVYYYKYVAASSFGEKTALKMELLNKIKEESPESKTLYLPLMAESALAEGKYDEMISIANELAEINCESPYSWWYKIVAYRLQGNIPKASNACNEALEINPDNAIINYQMAVICLLQGKTETATTYASTAYENATTLNSFLSSASLYSLCSQLKGDEETVKSINEEVDSYGYDISEDVAAVIDGSKKIEDIFMKGTGDFEWD